MYPVIPQTPLTQLGSWQNARVTGGAGILPAANLRSWYHLKHFKKPAEVRCSEIAVVVPARATGPLRLADGGVIQARRKRTTRWSHSPAR
jgi:hypothetical protein